jgi:uncharacterized protein (TIGR00297 family)
MQMSTLPQWMAALPQLLIVAGLTVIFADWAWGARAITSAAAITGTILTLVLCTAAGPGALAAIAVVFLLTHFSTRTGRSKKERLGSMEKREGRGPVQLLANLGAGTLCAVPLLFTPHARWLLLAATSAALAEAAGDTVSSELGQVFGRHPRLITTLRPVPPGKDGGITAAGSLLSVAAILITCWACEWANLLAPDYYWTAAAAAFAGTLLDSLLGATLERPGRLGNNSVNFTSSAFAAAVALLALVARRWM